MALREWGDKYMADDGPLLSIRHRDCGGEAHVHLSCDRCGEEISARGADVAPGPGLAAAAKA